jgi:type II secretory ATPase GspE/PulE/Tfp pilus assembly ATPase PilB-like protein
MLTSLSDRVERTVIDGEQFGNSCRSHPEWAVRVDTEKVFQLIDQILPFEACLYHQILPLEVVDGRLHLGMVMIEDTVALDYVRRFVGYMNYSLAPRSIASGTHYSTLTAYLNYAQNRPKKTGESSPESSQPPKKAPDLQATLVLDSPDELEWQEVYKAEARSLQETICEVTPGNSLPVLDVAGYHRGTSIEALTTLPSADLLQELLARVLTNGIGRLYFERQSDSGRVLWSQNGVLQSVLEALPLSQFEGLLDQLKILTHLPLEPVQQVKQVEIERLCQKHRVLLRLRLMPNALGEEATLQVLRGAALKFYQRQQLTRLGRDALGIAQKLQQKVGEIHDRANLQSSIDQLQPEVGSEIDQVLQIVEKQVSDLKRLRGSEGSN